MRFLRKHLSGGGLSFRALLLKAVNHVLSEHEILTRASAIAFSAMMAFIPFLALSLTVVACVLPDLGQPGSVGPAGISSEAVRAALLRVLPPEVLAVVAEQIGRIQSRPPLAIMSFSLLVTLWAASGLFVQVIDAINRIYGVKESRPWWRVRLIAVGLTLVECVLLFACLLAIVAWPQILAVTGLDGSGATFATACQWLLVTLTLVVNFAAVFRLGPASESGSRWVTPGSLFGTVGFLSASYLFRAYVQGFARYELAYGSLGGVMMLLVWFWLIAVVLLVAAEMNRLAAMASRKP